jgi:hypothetical protein
VYVQLPRAVRVGDPVDLDVHPRLGGRALGRLGGVGGRVDLQQLPGDVPADDHNGVNEALHLDAVARELGGDRVDEVRHVVSDDLHDGRFARPAVFGGGGVEEADAGPTGHTLLGELAVGAHGADEVDRVVAEDLFGGQVTVVEANEVGDVGRVLGGSLDQLVPDLLRAGQSPLKGLPP